MKSPMGKKLILKADSKSRKEEAQETLQAYLKELPENISSKLSKIADSSTPMKERLQIEMEMGQDSQERKFLAEFRHFQERKTALVNHDKVTEKANKQLAKNLQEEALRKKAEDKTLQEKLRKKQQEKQEQIDRERQVQIASRKHYVEEVAKGAETLRKQAEQALEGTKRTQAKKQEEEEEIRRKVQEFRETDGRKLTDVTRVLTEARLEQRDIQFR